MSAVAFPNPIPSFVKGAWKYLSAPHPTFYDELLQYLENRSTSDTWRHLYVRFHNTSSGAAAADDFFITFDILNITAGLPDSTWTTGDYTTVETLMDTYLATQMDHTANWLTVSEYRWYVREFGELGDKPFVDHGPPVRSQAKTMVGTGANLGAAQTAITVTERTAWARHWGRFYLPMSPLQSIIQAGGRLTSAGTVSLASAYQGFLASLASSDFQMVVPVTQVDKAPVRDLLTVSSVQVDDIIDVMRSRRPRNALVRTVKP